MLLLAWIKYNKTHALVLVREKALNLVSLST